MDGESGTKFHLQLKKQKFEKKDEFIAVLMHNDEKNHSKMSFNGPQKVEKKMEKFQKMRILLEKVIILI